MTNIPTTRFESASDFVRALRRTEWLDRHPAKCREQRRRPIFAEGVVANDGRPPFQGLYLQRAKCAGSRFGAWHGAILGEETVNAIVTPWRG